MHLSLGVKMRPEPPIRCPSHSPLTGASFVPPQTKPAGGTVALGAQDRGSSVPTLSQVGSPPVACPQGACGSDLLSVFPDTFTDCLWEVSSSSPVSPGKRVPSSPDPGKSWGERPRAAPSLPAWLPYYLALDSAISFLACTQHLGPQAM